MLNDQAEKWKTDAEEYHGARGEILYIAVVLLDCYVCERMTFAWYMTYSCVCMKGSPYSLSVAVILPGGMINTDSNYKTKIAQGSIQDFQLGEEDGQMKSSNWYDNIIFMTTMFHYGLQYYWRTERAHIQLVVQLARVSDDAFWS